MKAIAIINMPDCCYLCPFFIELQDSVNHKCCLNGFSAEPFDTREERSKDCPLCAVDVDVYRREILGRNE